MNFNVLAWLFVVAFAAHNVEEGYFITQILGMMPLWYADAEQFRFAAIAVALPAPLLAWLATRRNGTATYVLCGMALAMLLNVFLPHLLGTIVLGRYLAGLVTAVLLILPVTALLLRRAFQEQRIVWRTFVWAGPLTVVAMAASIPVLFALARLVRVT